MQKLLKRVLQILILQMKCSGPGQRFAISKGWFSQEEPRTTGETLEEDNTLVTVEEMEPERDYYWTASELINKASLGVCVQVGGVS